LHLKFTGYIYLSLLLLCFGKTLHAQQPVVLPQPSDTIRIINIVQSKNLREKNIDSATTIETAAGDVIIKEGLTTTYCDSVVINRRTNEVEAFGNVHINDNDSIHTYAQYLKYIGGERIAYLKKNVKLTDKKGTLLTEDLEYNLRTGIATYKNGGRVLNGKTVLTSTDGVYYANTKDVYFKKKVHLKDPKYDITTDSLLYNVTRDEAQFIAPTHIVSKDGIIDTKSGIYNLKTGQAIFNDRTNFRDSVRSFIADKVFSDEKTGIIQLDGRAKLVDSVNKVTVIGNHIELNKKENSFLAYNKPVMILYKDNDSTYIAADTLFSGLRKYDIVQGKRIEKNEIKDTLKKAVALNVDLKDSTDVFKSRRKTDGLLNKIFAKKDTAQKTVLPDAGETDTTTATFNLTKKDSLQKGQFVKTDSVKKETITNINKPGTALTGITKSDSLQKKQLIKTDTLKKAAAINLNAKDTSIRYFLAFHHVRIFNDSLQSVSDSLYYSTEDSTFKLFGQPLVWNGKSQIAGDTIYMYTENQKPKRVYVFYNSIVINKTAEQLFNQIAGRRLNGYFKNGELDYIRVNGSPAESIFYPQDDDSAYTGMNRSSGDVIDVYFVKKELNKVKFVNNVDGVMYPIRQIPADKKQLKNFKWQDARRPKNKLELFE
jgi:lipopolysaccharide export system protein LptA